MFKTLLPRIIPASFACFIILATTVPAAETVTRDGVLHVMNPASPGGGREIRTLAEVWRAGGEDSDDFFGLITQVIADEDGNLYLLDTRLAEVPVYSPDGERIATLSREGEGPGETRFPGDLIFMPDGTLGLVQAFPGRVVNIDRQGNPLESFTLAGVGGQQGGFVAFSDVRASGDRLVVGGSRFHQIENGRRQEIFVAAFDRQGNLLTEYFTHDIVQDFSDFTWDDDAYYLREYRRWTVGTDGRIYSLQDPNRYAITVYRPAGGVDRVIERAYEHRLRTDEELQQMQTNVEARILRQLPDAKIEIAPDEPDVLALRTGPDGNIWAETSRGAFDQPAGVLFTWDVFSPDGEFLKQVSARTDGDGTEELLLWVKDGAVKITGFWPAVAALRNGGVGNATEDEEATPMEVIYYRVADVTHES